MVEISQSVFKSVIVKGATGEDLRIDEGTKISFILESTGEVKQGIVTKISGKKEKTKFQIVPDGTEFEEIHGIAAMKENSLKVVQ